MKTLSSPKANLMKDTQEYLFEHEGHKELTRVTTFVNSFEDKLNTRIKCEHEEFIVDDEVIYKKLTIAGKYTADMHKAFSLYDFDEFIIENGDWEGLELDELITKRVTKLHLGTQNVNSQILERFGNLEELYVGGKFSQPLSFKKLTKLKALELTYSSTFYGFEDLVELEVLKINAWKEDRLELSHFKHLKYLRLIKPNGLKNLDNVALIPNLEYLEVYSAPQLIDCQSLSSCKELKYLKLESCKKLTDIDFLRSLDLLELAFLTGTDIDSVGYLLPLNKLKNLVVGGGSKFKDGNLSLLLSEFDLEYLRLDNTRHYKPKSTDIVSDITKKTKVYTPFQKSGLYI